MSKKQYHFFLDSLKNPTRPQQKLLNKVLKDLSSSEYGAGYKECKHYLDFKENIPIIEYGDVEQKIEEQFKRRCNYFNNQKVLFYERTSGSSGKEKLIPYTKNLLKSFNTMLTIWIHDVLLNLPMLKTGKMFFSISPALVDKERDVGLKDDRGYISSLKIKY